MGSLAMPQTELAYQDLNGQPMTEPRIMAWARAINKAEDLAAKGYAVVGRGRHPQTKAPFVVMPSATTKGHVHYSVKTPNGYCCLGCEAKSGICWHNAAHMLQSEPQRAAAIKDEAKAIAARASLAQDNARKDAMLPVSRPNSGPRIFR